MGLVSYRVTFPGPVGKVDGQLAATVVVVPESRTPGVLEGRLDEAIRKYLRTVGASQARSITCHPAMLDDLSAGQGPIMAGPNAIKQTRIGTFQLERMGDAGATE